MHARQRQKIPRYPGLEQVQSRLPQQTDHHPTQDSWNIKFSLYGRARRTY